MKIDWKKVPNKLTAARIFFVPVVLACLIIDFGGNAHFWIAAVIFVLSAITDSLDGIIARKYNAVTNVGKFLDPLADKILVTGVMIWIATDLGQEWMTLVTIVMVLRDFVISGFRMIVATVGGKVIAADWLGKLKTVTQYVALVAYMLSHTVFGDFAWRVFIGMILSATVLSVWSCADYLSHNWYLLAADEEKKDDM